MHNLPKDHKLKFYFDPATTSSQDDVLATMQVVQLIVPLLTPIKLSVDFQRW